ncbi:uncharacterized protein METZ01_LOCUS263218, partial [marine metagenome]
MIHQNIENIDGIFNVNKPTGITSTEVVRMF